MLDPATINSIIRNRHSLFPPQMDENKKIEDEVILKILENANYAPSHYRTEPWRFIVFSGSAVNDFFDQMWEIFKKLTPKEEQSDAKQKKWQMKAQKLSHVIAICMKRDEKERLPKKEEEWAVACAVQNIHLSCEAYGVGGYWGTGNLAYTNEMKEYLQLEKQTECMGFFQMGIPKSDLKLMDKKPLSAVDEKIIWKK